MISIDEIESFKTDKDGYALYLVRIGAFTFEKSGRVNMSAIDRELGFKNGRTRHVKRTAAKKQSV